MQHKPIAAGGSSFNLIDSPKLFSEIELKAGMTFLDVACGFGYYSLAASRYVGNTGLVYSVDLWKDGIDHLKNQINEQKINTIQAILADVTQRIPLKNSSVDMGLLSTVLHDFILEKTEDAVLKEINRVLKPDGKFAVIEFKKIESHPGPPIAIRITPAEVETRVAPQGFQIIKTVEIGESHYLSLFQKRVIRVFIQKLLE